MISDNKGPRANGFSASFFKTAWSIVGGDFVKARC